MFRKCCITGCDSKRKEVNLFGFPSNEIGFQKWLECIDCEQFLNMTVEDIRKQYVCQKHFEKRFIATTTTRPRLRVGAYPTLFSDSEISSGVSQIKHTDHFDYAISDHTYTKKRLHGDHTYYTYEPTEKRTKAGIDSIQSHLEKSVEDSAVSYGNMLSRAGHGDKFATTSTVESTINVSTPKRKVPKRRLVLSKKSLTPNCAKLYCEYIKSRRQLQFNVRARRALKFSKEKYFQEITRKMNPLAKKIMWMQIKQCTKKAQGRRFSTEEKLIALSILKQSPKCYKFLHKIFILPTKHTLNKMVSKLNIEAGISPQLFAAVKQEVKTWEENKKFCSVLFDEIALETALTYDQKRDLISGFVELPERTLDFADHALVFMLRGALHKWQQPLVYYFCKGATSGLQLKLIIKEVVAAVGDTGLLPIAVVCDQGTAFQFALKSLQEDTRKEQIKAGEVIDEVISINGLKLSIIYDPPHLIKGLRNNFLSKNIKLDGKISKWNDIVDVYKADCNHAQIRLLHKLNDEHVIPDKIKKMKVKNCVRVFSKAVAAALAYTAQFSQYADGSSVSPTLKNTAELVSFFDDLFDSVNGASLWNKSNKGKPLKKAVTSTSQHHNFWKSSIKKLQNIKFLDSKTNREISVPSLKNWVISLKSYQRLWHFFQKKNIKIMRPRYFNSDPIENFFGQIRSYNYRNVNPNCHTFKNTFKSLLITRFIKFHSDSFNCEEDSGEQLVKFKTLFQTTDINLDITSSAGSSSQHDVVENISITATQERLLVVSRAYTTGWVIRKIINKKYCKHCQDNLTSEKSNNVNDWISFREFKCVKKRKLIYPSENAVRYFGFVIQEANEYLEFKPQQAGLIKQLKIKIKSKYSFDFLNCELHRDAVIESFLEWSLKLAVFNWCNIINKIMKGTDIARLENKNLPPMHQRALLKFKKILKNKTNK